MFQLKPCSCIHFSTNYSLYWNGERLVGLSFFRGKCDCACCVLYVLLYSVISPHSR
nr:MAG TPA: hypothetical protein [Caudoviricetes sp.]